MMMNKQQFYVNPFKRRSNRISSDAHSYSPTAFLESPRNGHSLSHVKGPGRTTLHIDLWRQHNEKQFERGGRRRDRMGI
jgi:hypothetical protein